MAIEITKQDKINFANLVITELQKDNKLNLVLSSKGEELTELIKTYMLKVLDNQEEFRAKYKNDTDFKKYFDGVVYDLLTKELF